MSEIQKETFEIFNTYYLLPEKLIFLIKKLWYIKVNAIKSL